MCCWLVLKAGQEGGTGTIGDISPVINVASCPDGHYIEVLLFMRFLVDSGERPLYSFSDGDIWVAGTGVSCSPRLNPLKEPSLFEH